MGWRFIWYLMIERDDRLPDERSWPGRLVFFAVVGLAAIGVVTVWWLRR